jgi:sirohydrochlorin cobaltochelatase
MDETRLVLFAHGSTDPSWLLTFKDLYWDVSLDLGPDRVRLAFMEFADPTLAATAADAARDGVTRLQVLPLFLSSGGHVSRDIPGLVEAVRREYPEVGIEILPPVGEHPRFGLLVRDIAQSTVALTRGEKRPCR